MQTLAELLKRHHDLITRYLHLGYVRWDDLIVRIERQERNPFSCLGDEQVWTFLSRGGTQQPEKKGQPC